jgi:nitrate reductase gamma subunit
MLQTCEEFFTGTSDILTLILISIAHLVGFALKLRNLGVSDHGLIRELSAPLAGSLYTGGGHSSLYDETRIYE